MGKHLVLVGGGHAHLATLKQLDHFTRRGYRVTVVSPSPFHDYSGMGPGLLSGRHRLVQGRFNIARMTSIRGGRFLEAAATGIDPARRELQLDNNDTITYDVISFNCGSEVTLAAPATSLGKSVFPVKPVANLFLARQKIIETSRTADREIRILVVGGGPAGCEVVGNLQALLHIEKIQARVTLVAGSQLLAQFSSTLRDKARKLLARKPLQLFEDVPVRRLAAHKAELTDGRTIDFDFAFIASGIKPTGPFGDSGLENNGSGLTVNAFLQSPLHPEIFGGGDCIDFAERPVDRVGVYAVRQGPILRHNLMAALEHKPLLRFQPQSRYLLIFNLGLGRGLFSGYGLTYAGSPAIWIKSRLDHGFMRKFQELN